jgi:hypothetical protein
MTPMSLYLNLAPLRTNTPPQRSLLLLINQARWSAVLLPTLNEHQGVNRLWLMIQLILTSPDFIIASKSGTDQLIQQIVTCQPAARGETTLGIDLRIFRQS